MDRIQGIWELGCEKENSIFMVTNLKPLTETYNYIAFPSVLTVGNAAAVLVVPVTQSPTEITDVFIFLSHH